MLSPSPIPLLRARTDLPHPERTWRRGEIVRVTRGVFACATDWEALPSWDQYLARVHATALTHPDAIFSHESAAALYGITISPNSRPVHVIDSGGTARENAGMRTHVSRDDREIVRLDGILLTAPHDTAVDLARTRPEAEALAFANELLRLEPAPGPEALRAINESRMSSRGRRHARWALDRADGVPESVLESMSLAVIEWLGFDVPLRQQEFTTEGHRDRADFFWPEESVIGEADGALKYAGERGEHALVMEKRREDRLRTRVAGFARWGWPELRDSALLEQRLRRAGVHPTTSRDSAKLARFALSHDPRP